MFTVIKANGQKEPFSEEKVLHSMQRAGVPRELQPEALNHIKQTLKDNISTVEIYRHITEYLGRSPFPFVKAKYSLKQAIMLMGPTGYPFEDYISLILSEMGYQTEVRQILMGKCVGHEIDVIAEKDGKRAIVEAKFHNNPGVRSDVHVALYTKSRFEDLKVKHTLDESWIVTNTKTTTDAIAYAECMGMRTISWSYPEVDNLRDLIEKFKLYPITSLTTLTPGQKKVMIDNHIVTCKQVQTDQKLLDRLYLTAQDKKKVLEEVKYMCS